MPHAIIKSINNNKWTISILEHSSYVLTINKPNIEPKKIFNIGDFTIYEIQIIRNDTEQQINYSFKTTSSEKNTSSDNNKTTSSDNNTTTESFGSLVRLSPFYPFLYF